MTAIGIVAFFFCVWAFLPESAVEWSKNFVSSRNEKWKKIFGCKVEEENEN